jgi:hypothetical protein
VERKKAEIPEKQQEAGNDQEQGEKWANPVVRRHIGEVLLWRLLVPVRARLAIGIVVVTHGRLLA